jgi:hypothetical protein
MSTPLGTYTFLPWLRQGVANRISGTTAAIRTTIGVSLQLEGTPKAGGSASVVTINRDVELYGPGDIIGIDSAQISRLEPAPWVTNFEPNYLAAIEFYDEDFPWRYTPAPPTDRKLFPWLAVVVFEEETEFKEGVAATERPLPFVEVTADFADVFPDSAEGWAWAHAHFNSELSAEVVETDAIRAAQAAQNIINTARDTACSRLLCPRKLKPKTSYHAFLIPAFESGRLAGLGHDPKPLFDDAANTLNATSSSWGSYGVPANRPDPTLFPFYHRWYFRTAENGDFESLVRLLKPKVVDSRVGHRDMDVTDPAPNITGIEDPELGGILRLGGALKAPLETLDEEEQEEFEKYDEWALPEPHEFQSQLAAFVNLADSYQETGAGANADPALDDAVTTDPDPLITPPIYGRWHALTERLLTQRDGSSVPHPSNWVHDLNLDPRWRAAAGFGTKVIQDNQETYMEAAWDQIGSVLEANRRIRQAQLAKAAGRRLYAMHIEGAAAVSPATLLMTVAPMKARLLSDGITVHHRVAESPMSLAMTSTAMRRLIRPGGKVSKRLNLNGAGGGAKLVERANNREVTAAPEKEPPANILTPDDLADSIAPATPEDQRWARIGKWIRENRLLFIGLIGLAILIVLLIFGIGIVGLLVAAAIAGAAIAVWQRARRSADRQVISEGLKEENLKPTVVDTMAGSSGFTLTAELDPRFAPPVLPVPRGQSDNVEAGRFKSALRDAYRLIDTGRVLGQVPPTVSLNLERVSTDIRAGIKPDLTVPRWTFSGITIPPRIKDQIGDDFVEVMAYPEFDIPMYEPLVKTDKDGFVPNLHLVEPDSVTLLETNQRFIEAYMVGINHEFARELLWREYPTDQRGSYFRQFWDVRKKIAEAADKAAARERLKDIKPIHEWPISGNLGENDNREVGPEPEEELVLVIRGELLKKYPNTIISAQPAKWQLTNGRPDKSKERQLDETVPPIFPLYEARVAPDIYFFGFDLTAAIARGDDTVDDKPGWFFRIEEVPGDARFGFDISRAPTDDINVWNDLSWPDVVPGIADGDHIKMSTIPEHPLNEPVGGESEKHQQWEFDREVPLDADMSAAELAYIALQTPVIMAIHASELLPNQEG